MLSPYIDCISASNDLCRISPMQLTATMTAGSPLKPNDLPCIIRILTAFYGL